MTEIAEIKRGSSRQPAMADKQPATPQPMEVAMAEKNDTDNRPAALQPMCECGHCQVLPNFRELECVCCREMGAPLTVAQPQGCISEHPDFNVLFLNIAVLRVAYLELRSWGNTMDDEMHKRYRYTAYRQFVRWLWGRLRKGERFVLPSCAVAKIRAAFPTETPTGFKYPNS
ncbi:hypothetical protein HPB49_026334 [Dermacentor silvarum]|nr:hypothetical protein HPB49_026334 [Dermacentor silvarum]